ncbi:hypothetical protein N7508_000349 [Penicillium antarcticum]|nr:uncharacterized protein N7508_000349 [Penicillium antarcticum]KAJ5320066.1 hypothetical protein N7508_000349 [Penicillium antarcticum]
MFTVKPDSNAVTNDRSVARRRLQSQTGGLLALYPGLDIFSVYMLLAFTIMNVARFFTVEGAQTPVSILYMLFSGLLLTNLHTAWIHAIISKPTNKTLWQRIPGWREWVGILPTASLDIILPSLAHYLTKSWMLFLRGICSAALNAWFDEKISSELETTGILIFFFAPYVSEIFVSTVMRTIYIRVAASMLPDNDEPIVPFDRSFGGRARTSERYCLGIFDAVRTMPFLNWYRYAKIIWEVLWYEEIWAVVLGIVLAMEFYYWAPCSVMELLVLVLPDDF